MSRWAPVLLLSVALVAPAGEQEKEERKATEAEPQEQAPPEEDVSVAPKVYSFNPLQAAKELQIGNFYFKKGSYRAAALRFREATRWNSELAEAWLRLAEAEEKQKDFAAAREAYTKYLELEPDAKNARSIRKKIKQR
jgi:tetratricopeptide (TPR) repeat protein